MPLYGGYGGYNMAGLTNNNSLIGQGLPKGITPFVNNHPAWAPSLVAAPHNKIKWNFNSAPPTSNTSSGLPGWTLNIDVEEQELDNWCWCACVAATHNHASPYTRITQCEVANYGLKRTDCCNLHLSPHPCDKGGAPADALQKFGNFKSNSNSKPSFDTVMSEIRNGCPILVGYARPGTTTGHAILIDEYRLKPDHVKNPAGRIVVYKDPFYPTAQQVKSAIWDKFETEIGSTGKVGYCLTK